MKSWETANFSDLIGKTLISCRQDGDELLFETEDAEYRLYHEQECCEDVYIEDLNGDLDNLVGSPIIHAEESTNDGEAHKHRSVTWTFYKIATVKGWVDVRWYGTSNGYYSEGVDFAVRQKPPIDRTSPAGIRYTLAPVKITTTDQLSPNGIAEGQDVGFVIIDDVPIRSGFVDDGRKKACLFCILRDEPSIQTDDGKWQTTVYA